MHAPGRCTPMPCAVNANTPYSACPLGSARQHSAQSILLPCAVHVNAPCMLTPHAVHTNSLCSAHPLGSACYCPVVSAPFALSAALHLQEAALSSECACLRLWLNGWLVQQALHYLICKYLGSSKCACGYDRKTTCLRHCVMSGGV